MARSSLLSSLREDHVNAARLLDLLTREAQMIRDGDDVDYDVIEGVLDYFTGYPDAFHHPLEDQVLNRLLAVDPDRAAAIGDLLADHARMRRDTADLFTTLKGVRLEAEIPRDTLLQKLDSFVEMYRAHMAAEEDRFFPLAEEVLGAVDLRKRLLAFENNL
jgi:hemerythrin-like domain-containing protein